MIWPRIKKCTCAVCIGMTVCVLSIVAATESPDCERAICRTFQTDLPHAHDEDRSPSPATQKFSAIATSSASDTKVHHLKADDLTVGPPELGTPTLRVI